jgi:hypothetical protein
MGVTVPAPSVRPRPGPSAITPPEITPIAAPLSATPSSTKDSVELLLEGMAGPRPERRKTTAQSDGEASASYHAEHGVHRARTSEPAPPKVVVERPALGAVMAERPASPVRASREALSTFVPARVLRRRVAMAIVAGGLFVLLSFMALRLTDRHAGAASARPTETPSVPAQVTASPVAAPAATTEIVSMPTIVPPPSAPAAEARADDAPPVPVATGGSTHHRHADSDPARPRAAGDAPASTGDLGEFKSKF